MYRLLVNGPSDIGNMLIAEQIVGCFVESQAVPVENVNG